MSPLMVAWWQACCRGLGSLELSVERHTALLWQRPQVGNLAPLTRVQALHQSPHHQDEQLWKCTQPKHTHTLPTPLAHWSFVQKFRTSHACIHQNALHCLTLNMYETPLNKIWLWWSRQGTLSGGSSMFQNVHLPRDWCWQGMLSVDSFDFLPHSTGLSAVGPLRAPKAVRGARMLLGMWAEGWAEWCAQAGRAKPTWLKWHECRSACSHSSLWQGSGLGRQAVLSSWAVNMTLEHWI